MPYDLGDFGDEEVGPQVQSSRQDDILHTRVLCKPKPWSGDRQDWKRFAFQLSAYMQALIPELFRIMRIPVNVANPLAQLNMMPEQNVSNMEGQALQEIMNCLDRHSRGASRRVTEKNQPNALGHQWAMRMMIARPMLTGN